MKKICVSMACVCVCVCVCGVGTSARVFYLVLFSILFVWGRGRLLLLKTG